MCISTHTFTCSVEQVHSAINLSICGRLALPRDLTLSWQSNDGIYLIRLFTRRGRLVFVSLQLHITNNRLVYRFSEQDERKVGGGLDVS